ncbi:phage Gp37/Gp68 family protein [Corallococcus praedator]|uniref:Phage Gp37/Gp68 family protein n=1 Tax=Corallococcus praedator TaxID=2316724 RepID=A0ABX9QEK3_9BACT|nr:MULTISPECIES: phage Gp37/Gp68 family protein [Corallococcus]RKH29934.1 phage Gp37/Gp68 family protein [Corallococcus sp. CA031C]RKI02173.1 phage Gp37/Gp68 family protein [Corallococcus praedator]
MADNSKIEWTDATWNPVRGCVKLSPGCKHCYAETFAERFRGVPGHPYTQGFDLRLIPGKLAEPLRWKASKRVFVNSMSDLFLDEVPEAYIETVARVMALADWHTFQVLTKRSERMQRLLSTRLAFAARLPNVWWGVSVEDRRYGLPRVKHLQATQARVRFLSVEPLLEDLGPVDFTGVDGVIVGGESGAKARPLDPAWVRSVREQCDAAGVAFFFKQWGGVRKATTGRVLDGRTYDALPRSTVAPAPDEARRLRLLAEAEALAAPWLVPPAMALGA